MGFHDAIFRGARHNKLYNCWSSLLRSRIHAFVLSCSLVDPGYMVPCVPEHAEIRDALEDRDRDRAVDLIEHHLSSAHERMMQWEETETKPGYAERKGGEDEPGTE